MINRIIKLADEAAASKLQRCKDAKMQRCKDAKIYYTLGVVWLTGSS